MYMAYHNTHDVDYGLPMPMVLAKPMSRATHGPKTRAEEGGGGIGNTGINVYK